MHTRKTGQFLTDHIGQDLTKAVLMEMLKL